VEVPQIARMLWLDDDLAETLALAHELGHPPFGHTAAFGGVDHNAQSPRP
jgi:dGTPase